MMKSQLGIVCCILLSLGTSALAHSDPPAKESGKDTDRAKYAEATAQAREATRWRKLGDEHRKRGDFSLAIESYETSLSILASGSDVRAGLGDALAAQRRYDEAVENYRIGLGMVPGLNWSDSRQTDGDLQIRFALLLSKMRRYEEAIAMYRTGLGFMRGRHIALLDLPFSPKALDKKAFSCAARSALGIEYVRQNQMDEAHAELLEALRINPDFAPAYLFLGKMFDRKGKSQEARSALKKAIELGGDDVKREAEEEMRIL